MRDLKQSSTAQPLVFLLVDSGDHITGKTGLTPTVTLSKSGAAFAAPAGAVTEIANGWYKVAGNATDTNTLGPLILHATGTAADPVDVEYAVVAYDVQDTVRLGLTSMPNAAAGANGGLPLLSAGATTLAYTVSTVTTLTGHTGQTGDTFARIGAPVGASISADIAAKVATAALPANFGLLSINGAGSIARVVLTDTATTLTGHTAQTGDTFARIGAPVGASISADIAAKVASAALPANFALLSITGAGAISHVILADTATTLTGHTAQTGDTFARIGAPVGASISADIAAKVATAALPANFGLLSITGAGALAHVILADTVTTLTGHTAQSGDAFARLGAPAGASLAADAAAMLVQVQKIPRIGFATTWTNTGSTSTSDTVAITAG